MMHRIIPACQNKCAFCGKYAETQEHVKQCQNGKAAEVRKAILQDIVNLMIKARTKRDEKLRDPEEESKFKVWVTQVMQKMLIDGRSSVSMSHTPGIDRLTEKLSEEDATMFNRGIATKPFVDLLKIIVP